MTQQASIYCMDVDGLSPIFTGPINVGQYKLQSADFCQYDLFVVSWCDTGPALMAVWYKALQMTASCFSPLPGFES